VTAGFSRASRTRDSSITSHGNTPAPVRPSTAVLGGVERRVKNGLTSGLSIGAHEPESDECYILTLKEGFSLTQGTSQLAHRQRISAMSMKNGRD